MRTLTIRVAKGFLANYKSINDPYSMSFRDNFVAARLDEQSKRYGFGDDCSKMAAACRKFLKDNKPAPTAKKKNRLRIEVMKFIGKNGAFGSEMEMYKTNLVGVNGKRRNINDWQNEGYGYASKQYADRDAAEWQKLFGCQIKFVDNTPKKGATNERKSS